MIFRLTHDILFTFLLAKYSIPRAIWKDQEIKSCVEKVGLQPFSASGW